jgi:hypothetical protein
MLYIGFNIMIFNRFSHTTTTQQKYNKFHFVVAANNVCTFCCGFVVVVTVYYKVNYICFTTKQQKIGDYGSHRDKTDQYPAIP